MELIEVISVEEAKSLVERSFAACRLGTETIPLRTASGRFLAADLFSAVTVPSFRRSTKDGYAVMSTDIASASDDSPVFLNLKGEVLMGKTAGLRVGLREAVYVPTGGMVPDGADSVLMIEYTETPGGDRLCAYKSTYKGENLINIGDDIRKGERVLRQGKKLTPADLGVLASIGFTGVEVFIRPKVAVISSGDEIAGPGDDISTGQVRDINTYSVSAAAENLGCEVTESLTVRDDERSLFEVLEKSVRENDMVFISGGSSVGTRDYSKRVIDSLGKPGILCRGIAFKPGKPTIIADIEGTPVIGLPGHPVSALVVFGLIGSRLFYLMNRSEPPLEFYIDAVLNEDISGAPERETWQMVRLRHDGTGYEASPVHGESGLITMLASANGAVRIPRYSGGIKRGSEVRVFPL